MRTENSPRHGRARCRALPPHTPPAPWPPAPQGTPHWAPSAALRGRWRRQGQWRRRWRLPGGAGALRIPSSG